MMQEFKDFAMKGNVVDLAVGVIIGAAFGKIVSSMVDNVLMPLIGLLMGGVDFTTRALTLGEGEGAAVLGYGTFIQSVIDFTIVAFVIFMIVRQINKMKKPEPEAAPAGPTQEELLAEIRDLMKK